MDVEDEARLQIFAVVDDVEADRGLPADAVVDGIANGRPVLAALRRQSASAVRTSTGRGRLPTCVDKIRVLRFIVFFSLAGEACCEVN